MKQVVFIVNALSEVKATQTSAMMMHRAADLNIAVSVVAVDGMSISTDGRVTGTARPFVTSEPFSTEGIARALHTMMQAAPSRMYIDQADVVLLRTNPGRDPRPWAHTAMLEMARYIRAAGVPVLNDPDGLAATASKSYLATLPDWVRPATLVSCDRDMLLEFVLQSDRPSVLKPVVGTRGDGVFRVERDDKNLNQILDLLLQRGQVVAQAFITEAEAGDTRVVVLDGRVLEHEGEVAAVSRVPGARDFRSNIHAGGTPKPGRVSEAMRRVVQEVGGRLQQQGVVLAGFDFIGSVLCEVNVFSTGGLHDAERFTGVPFSRIVVERLLNGEVAPANQPLASQN